eukprot:772134-Rhodomonas_salina.1
MPSSMCTSCPHSSLPRSPLTVAHTAPRTAHSTQHAQSRAGARAKGADTVLLCQCRCASSVSVLCQCRASHSVMSAGHRPA